MVVLVGKILFYLVCIIGEMDLNIIIFLIDVYCNCKIIKYKIICYLSKFGVYSIFFVYNIMFGVIKINNIFMLLYY